MNYIVTTTIFSPSKALKKFQEKEDWKLIVVGDKKTPHEEYIKNDKIIYLTPEYQEVKYKDLSDLIGWNCIQRRNLGYIEAFKRGANIIATIDDDNIPYDNWGSELFLNKETMCDIYYPTDSSIHVWDPFSATNYNNLWHRGYPINLIHTKNNVNKVHKTIIPTIQADFWNGDPDIDAIERMIYSPNCKFDNSVFPFSGDVISPFNSQNTFFTRDSIKNFYLFPHVGRMDDIWGSFYAQAKGEIIIYNKPTVEQERNQHNYLTDFSKEIEGYLHNEKLINDLTQDTENIKKYLPTHSYLSLLEYVKLFN
jgi:hypothetical protein